MDAGEFGRGLVGVGKCEAFKAPVVAELRTAECEARLDCLGPRAPTTMRVPAERGTVVMMFFFVSTALSRRDLRH